MPTVVIPSLGRSDVTVARLASLARRRFTADVVLILPRCRSGGFPAVKVVECDQEEHLAARDVIEAARVAACPHILVVGSSLPTFLPTANAVWTDGDNRRGIGVAEVNGRVMRIAYGLPLLWTNTFAASRDFLTRGLWPAGWLAHELADELAAESRVERLELKGRET